MENSDRLAKAVRDVLSQIVLIAQENSTRKIDLPAA